ncbi:MAG: translation initiation factor IF-3 [Bacteriovoracales bacterium]|nr:translation initiation factor IF-3 [Bacteriovoracales bacterium]
MKGPRVNLQIRADEVRLVADEGEPLGVLSLDEAIRIAKDKGLDLVEVSPNADPPVVRLIDYGKYKYTQQKKANEARKKQTTSNLKEIQFRPNIDTHDLGVKLRRAEAFVGQGDKVKLIMQFRGREMANKNVGLEKFDQIIKTVMDFGAQIESEPKFMGRRIIAILSPQKGKK